MNAFFLKILAILTLFSISSFSQEAVCSKVKIEIVQELTLERQAFEATMKINNGSLNKLQNIGVNVSFKDSEGNEIIATDDPDLVESTTAENATFFIKVISKENINEVDGTGEISASTEAIIKWLIIPTKNAGGADLNGVQYDIGAQLQYNDGAADHTVDVIPDTIFVYPMPDLQLDYFLPEYVLGDNPGNEVIEPSVPFSLGLRVKNSGYGPAKNLKISSGQPKIIDNVQGLLAGFKITGSEVNGQGAESSLLVDFGDIQPSSAGIARWIMESTLSGKFEDFTARFTHSDELGGELTSLIEEVNTHTLLGEVLLDNTGQDQIRDFLTKTPSDDVDFQGYDLKIYSSDGSEYGASYALNAVYSNGVVTRDAQPGFSFVSVEDNEFQNKQITEVRRSDGKVMNAANVWIAGRVQPDFSEVYSINIFDFEDQSSSASTYSYTISLEEKVNVKFPGFLPMEDIVFNIQDGQIDFTVNSVVFNGAQEDTAQVSMASVLATSAQFTDNNDGTGRFLWTPSKAGVFLFEFTALYEGKTAKATLKVSVVDGLPPKISFASQIIESSESEEYAEVKIILDRPYFEDVTVDYRVVSETSTALSIIDYTHDTLGTVTFAPGENEKVLKVFINDDTEIELEEVVDFVLENPSTNSSLGNDISSQLVISDNDLTNSLLIADGHVFKRFNPQTGELIDNFIEDLNLEDIGSGVIGANNELFVSSLRTDSIYEYDIITGDFLSIFSSIDLGTPKKSEFLFDSSLAVMTSNKILTLAINGTPTELINLQSGEFIDFAQMQDGNIIAIVSHEGVESLKVFSNQDGLEIPDYLINPPTFVKTTSLEFGPEGYLYISDTEDNCIYKYDFKTAATKFEDPLLIDPEELSFDLNGNLYISVSKAESDAVIKMDLSDQSFQEMTFEGEPLVDIRQMIFTGVEPRILEQPENQYINLGETVKFEVKALGTEALFYQWQKDGEDIVGETSPTLEILIEESTQPATYNCVVTNYVDSVVSEDAYLLNPIILNGLVSGDTINQNDLNLSWTDIGATEYQVLVGRTQGANDIEEHLGLNTNILSVNNITFNGDNIWLRLRALDGSIWQEIDYFFTTDIIKHTITYVADPAMGGFDLPEAQEVVDGANSIAVEVIPLEGYDFVKWDDESTENPRVFSEVREDIIATALFAIKTYSVEFLAGEYATIAENAIQEVEHGSSTLEIELVPNEGYEFVKWDNESTENPIIVDNVVEQITLTAVVQLKTYSVEFVAGTGGSISGVSSQSVPHGFDTSEVEAIASEGYEFVKWSDDVTDNPRTVTNVTSALSLTAEFQLKTYSVEFVAGTGGSISGVSSQSVPHGFDTSEVEAIASEGYEFVKWSDDVTDNPRTVTNVTSALSLTAEFQLKTYSVEFTAGTGGSISGLTPQSVIHGFDASEVEAIASEGYEFVKWSDDVTDNPRTITDIQSNLILIAEFQLKTYSVEFFAGVGGSISGSSSQSVVHNLNSTEVEAVASAGYEFVKWSDNVTDNPRTLTNVTEDISLTAEFTLIGYAVEFLADEGGSISGPASQTVLHDGSSEEVEAIASAGYEFVKWSDDITDNPRTLTNVTEDISLTAEFALAGYSIEFIAGSGGTITGDLTQIIPPNGSTTEVEAKANPGYFFKEWSDGVADNPRVIADVTSDLTLTAVFELEPVVSFELEFAQVVLTDQWQTVSYTKSFVDPVVVVGPPTDADPDPVTVRVKN